MSKWELQKEKITVTSIYPQLSISLVNGLESFFYVCLGSVCVCVCARASMWGFHGADIIKEFNAFKRVGSGIQVKDNEYYASGKIMDGLKKFWNFIKTKYNENRDVFQPITNALLNTATSTVTDVVNKGTTALTNKVAEKTNNPHINEIAKAVAKTGTDLGKRVNEKITESASVLS